MAYALGWRSGECPTTTGVNVAMTKAKLSLIQICLLLAAAILFPLAIAEAQSESFYKGKTLRFVVGSATANFYDSWARLIARYWGKYIQGNPNVIVQNMPGAGSLTRD